MTVGTGLFNVVQGSGFISYFVTRLNGECHAEYIRFHNRCINLCRTFYRNGHGHAPFRAVRVLIALGVPLFGSAPPRPVSPLAGEGPYIENELFIGSSGPVACNSSLKIHPRSTNLGTRCSCNSQPPPSSAFLTVQPHVFP